MNWRHDRIPYDDGRVIIVRLRPDTHPDWEHNGEPMTVRCWGSKFKTVTGAYRVDHSEILVWRNLDPKVVYQLQATGEHPESGQGHKVRSTVVYTEIEEADVRKGMFEAGCRESNQLGDAWPVRVSVKALEIV